MWKLGVPVLQLVLTQKLVLPWSLASGGAERQRGSCRGIFAGPTFRSGESCRPPPAGVTDLPAGAGRVALA